MVLFFSYCLVLFNSPYWFIHSLTNIPYKLSWCFSFCTSGFGLACLTFLIVHFHLMQNLFICNISPNVDLFRDAKPNQTCIHVSMFQSSNHQLIHVCVLTDLLILSNQICSTAHMQTRIPHIQRIKSTPKYFTNLVFRNQTLIKLLLLISY